MPLTIQQLFSWTIQLSAQQDYQALTHTFLAILDDMPGVDHASAYEMYEHERKNIGDTTTVHELLVRRFPLDFSRNDDENYNALFSKLNHTVDLHLSAVDEAGLYTWVIFSIRGGSGPERAIRIEGEFDPNRLNILDNLRLIYRNLVILHDTKERDVLTKLPNRQSLDVRLLQVCEHYRYIDNPEGESSWIAILDIDHFKRVNDDFGHLYGDEVLLTFSQLMGKCFRYNDFLFRFGGEEFVVILNLASQKMAMTIFNRFREAVANYHFPTVGRITVSIGLTRINGVSMPTTQLDCADKALYYAKENGRNQVILYENMIIPEQDNIANEIELF
ncbi:MAG: GGDEF domain-containing protein [Methylobacter sp.]|jgi:diguanylate cyclase (GGDEF)-like protein|nr:GGDEF domain-containing protein [Methylobacter sp.]